MIFETLQGLTIPEGVVTQITDASGRLLWRAGPPTVYLRPSEDLSLEHPVYPETLSAGYLAICERVSDGAATYIGGAGLTSEDDFDYTSTFKMSLSKPAKINRVVSAKIGVDATYSIAGSTTQRDSAYCACRVMASGQEVFRGEKGVTYTANGTEYYDQMTDGDTANLVAAINDFINRNGVGVFPEITVEVRNAFSASNTKGTYTSYLTRLCIELIYE